MELGDLGGRAWYPLDPLSITIVLQVEDLERVKVMSGKQLESFLKVSSWLGPSSPWPGPCSGSNAALPFPPVAGQHLGSRRGPALQPLLTASSSFHLAIFFPFQSLYNRFLYKYSFNFVASA